jgi:membrane-bound metal-dependent hydrolase YbcI (DUF457 family)
LCGLLPDTLDFKLVRYLETYDVEIDPHPHDLQPQAIAEQVAEAMRAAYDSQRPHSVMLHTARLGADLWREYSLRFDPGAGEVIVRVGPVVNTSQLPLPGSRPRENVEGRAIVGVPMVHTYDAETKINIFSGPSFCFERRGEELYVTFLPWHRRWTHSLTLAALLGLLVSLLLGPTAGLVSGLGFATHVLQDQLGFMGSNLLWPLTKSRTTGLRLLHSGDGLPNFLAVWLSAALILFNLDRFSDAPRLAAAPFLLLAVLLPCVVLGAVYARERRRGDRQTLEALRQGDIVAEVEEVDV